MRASSVVSTRSPLRVSQQPQAAGGTDNSDSQTSTAFPLTRAGGWFGVCGFGVCGFGECGFGECGFGVCGFGVGIGTPAVGGDSAALVLVLASASAGVLATTSRRRGEAVGAGEPTTGADILVSMGATRAKVSFGARVVHTQSGERDVESEVDVYVRRVCVRSAVEPRERERNGEEEEEGELAGERRLISAPAVAEERWSTVVDLGREGVGNGVAPCVQKHVRVREKWNASELDSIRMEGVSPPHKSLIAHFIVLFKI